MADAEYKLLYEIEAQGLDKLDGIAANQQKISLESRYSARELENFQKVLRATAVDGTSYRQALNEISRSTVEADATYKSIAKTLLENDRAQQNSTKAAERESASRIRSAEQEEKAWRRLQAAHEAALKENERRKEKGFLEENEHQLISGIRTSSILAGIHNTRSIDASLATVGGAAGIAGMVGTFAVGGAYNLVKEAAGQARELQNLANEFGMTAQAAFKLDAAAKLSGESLGSMGRVATKLDEALQNPATTGRKTAEELTKLGVDLHQNMGEALEDVLKKLAAMPDAGQRSAEAILLFGREGAKLAEVADNLKLVGQSLDENVQRKLLEAQKTLADWGNTWTIVKGQAAAAITSIAQGIGRLSDALDAATGATLTTNRRFQQLTQGDLQQANAAANAKLRPGVPAGYQPFGQSPALVRALGAGKLGLDEQISNAKRAYEDAKNQAQKDLGYKPEAEQAKEAASVEKLRLAYEKLEAQKKKAGKGPNVAGIENRFDSEMRKFAAEEYKAKYPASEYGRIPELQMRLQSDLGDINKRDSGFTASQKSILTAAAQKAANRAIIEEAKRLGDINFEKETKATAIGNAFRDAAPGINAKRLDAYYHYDLKDSLEGASAGFAADRQIAGINSNANLEGLKRSVGFQQRLATMQNGGQVTGGTIARGLGGELQIAQAEAQMRRQALEDSNSLYTADQKRVELAKIEADLRKATADAELSATEKVIELRQQAQQKNKEETGQFTSGLVNAAIDGQTGDFFRSFGRKTLSTVAGNFGKNLPFTMNSALSLGGTGALGTEDKPNFLGKLLEGTSLGLDHSKGGIESATSENTKATQLNTQALLAASGVGGTAIGAGGFAFGSGTGGISIPGLSGAITGTPSFLPSYMKNAGDGLPVDAGPGYSLPNLNDRSGFTRMGKFQSGMGELMGGMGTVMSGHGLQEVFTGQADLGNGQGQALSGLGRLGAGIGLAGAAAGGVMGAVSGFKSGGAKGIFQGVGSIAGAAAAFDPEPISRAALMIGGSVAGIISSLFPDAKQKRMDEMQKTVTNNAYVLPASQDVLSSFGGQGVGGFNRGVGGGIRQSAGNTVAPVTVNIHAMDAKSFVDFANSNQEAFGQAMLYGVQSGSGTAITNEITMRTGQAWT
jgi:hypothetical protein